MKNEKDIRKKLKFSILYQALDYVNLNVILMTKGKPREITEYKKTLFLWKFGKKCKNNDSLCVSLR